MTAGRLPYRSQHRGRTARRREEPVERRRPGTRSSLRPRFLTRRPHRRRPPFGVCREGFFHDMDPIKWDRAAGGVWTVALSLMP